MADQAANATAHDHDDGHHHHVMSPKVLIGTWLGLMVLTGLTVGAIKIDLGAQANLVLAMAIAGAKALLVCMIFMHLWFDQRYNLMVFFGSVICVVLFISITMIDTKRNVPFREAYDAKNRPTPEGRELVEPSVSPVVIEGSDEAAKAGEVQVKPSQKPRVPWPSQLPDTPRVAPTAW
ncbi:MAG: cytochrome C oxidase subunit IV family protein [Myxococcota bacterium]